MTSKDLANEGFIYTGKKDIVLCVYCGVIIEQWEEGDVPNMEHQKNSPRCPFVCMLSDIESTSGMSIYIALWQTFRSFDRYIYLIHLFNITNSSLFFKLPTLLILKNG